MVVPSLIESINPSLQPHASPLLSEQHNKLMSTVFREVICSNISTDPSCRMKPQNIVRKLVLLDERCKFTATLTLT